MALQILSRKLGHQILNNITNSTSTQILRCSSSQVSANKFIVTESPFKNDGWINKMKTAVGVGESNLFVLRRASIFHYEACTDNLVAEEFFKHFKLPDTVFSFFLVVELHVWMCQARSMADGPEGRKLRNEISERMWQDWDTRLKRVDLNAFNQRKGILQDLLFHQQGAMISYDEGLLSDDKTLAGALWRTLYSKSPIDPETIEMAVRYVRTQMNHLRSIGPREWCLDGRFDWAPFPPLRYKKSSA